MIVDEPLPSYVYPDYLQNRLHETLSDISSIPNHPGVLDVDIDDVTVIKVTKHDPRRAYQPE